MTSIVLVDDQELLRMGFRMVLDSQPDLEVVDEAGNGREAIALVDRRWIPDAAVLDLDMPLVDGLSVCRYLHSLDEDIRIVVVTGVEDRGPEAFGAGASEVLTKPCGREELVEALLHLSASFGVA